MAEIGLLVAPVGKNDVGARLGAEVRSDHGDDVRVGGEEGDRVENGIVVGGLNGEPDGECGAVNSALTIFAPEASVTSLATVPKYCWASDR